MEPGRWAVEGAEITAERRGTGEVGFGRRVWIHPPGMCVRCEALKQAAVLASNVRLFQREVGRAGAYSK